MQQYTFTLTLYEASVDGQKALYYINLINIEKFRNSAQLDLENFWSKASPFGQFDLDRIWLGAFHVNIFR